MIFRRIIIDQIIVRYAGILRYFKKIISKKVLSP